ncbi:hypothetical protein SDC9_80466 [bioreactor metagenome]|uniref:Uncharacterized protein n=1 Tax=bioreactor metagenome TaxID=1076179 RepID=A0A644YZ28_9ZZZZ
MTQRDDAGPFGFFAFGEDGGFGADLAAGLLYDLTHGLHGGSGANDIVDDHHIFALHQFQVLLVQVKGLGFASCDRHGLVLQSFTHVGFVGFTQDHIGFLHFNGEGIGQWDALGFCGHQHITGSVGQFFGQGFGTGLGQFGIAQNVQNSDTQTGFDLEQCQLAMHTGNIN